MFKSVVFARFKPWQKAEVIKKLKSIGLKVGMIGIKLIHTHNVFIIYT